jgi:ribosomal protein S12 methylthiotransferase
MLDLVAHLGEIAKPYGAWVRLHYVYPYPHVDEVLPLMAEPRLGLPGRALPARPPDVLKRMKRPANGEKNWSASCAGARPARSW